MSNPSQSSSDLREPIPRLLTAAAAATQLGCHPETIRRAIRAGALACYRLGGCTRIAPEQLAAYLERHRCPARDPQDPSSNSAAASGASSGGTEASVAGFRQGRRTRRALDRASRISKPALSVVPPS